MITLTNGAVQGANGVLNANGSLSLQLTADANVIGSPIYVVAALPVTFRFDANGNLLGSCKVWSNAELSGNTQYAVNFYDNNNARLGNPAVWQFTQAAGSVVDIGTMVATTPGGPAVSFPFGQLTQAAAANMSFPASSYNGFVITMGANVSSSSMVGGVPAQYITFKVIQDATGGRTFSWPANVLNPGIPDPTPNAISVQTFYFDGTNLYPIGPLTTN